MINNDDSIGDNDNNTAPTVSTTAPSELMTTGFWMAGDSETPRGRLWKVSSTANRDGRQLGSQDGRQISPGVGGSELDHLINLDRPRL